MSFANNEAVKHRYIDVILSEFMSVILPYWWLEVMMAGSYPLLCLLYRSYLYSPAGIKGASGAVALLRVPLELLLYYQR